MELLRVVNSYDIILGYRFLTYAKWWILNSIKSAIAEKDNCINYSKNVYEELRDFRYKISLLTIAYQRKPTIYEIADLLDLKIERVNKLIQFNSGITSLNLEINDDGDNELIDLIPGNNVSLDDEIVKSQMRQELVELLNKVDFVAREKEVLLLRYGFYNNKIYTLRVYLWKNKDYRKKCTKKN